MPAAALLLAAATSLSVYVIGVRLWGLTTDVVVIATPFVNTAVCLPLWLLFDGSLADAPLSEIALQALYQGLVVSILATALFTICIRRVGALAAALAMAFVPVVTPLLAALAIGETPGAVLIIIAAATTAGVAVSALGSARSTTRQCLDGLPQNAKG
jgi:drug/metabolite transporter (DMT)-like permease